MYHYVAPDALETNFFPYICSMDLYYQLRYKVSSKMMALAKKVQETAEVEEIYFIEPVDNVVSVKKIPKLSGGTYVSPLNLKTSTLMKMISSLLSRKIYFYKEYQGQKLKVKLKPVNGNH